MDQCWKIGMDFRASLIFGRFEMNIARFFLRSIGISETFEVEGLTWMIRATRGRSRRPNHMRSQIGSPKAMPPVDLRRLAGGFHSVAKQASFNIAFWSHFSGFGRPKSMPKFDLEPFFSMTFSKAL